MDSRRLLDLAAEYVEARQAASAAADYPFPGAVPGRTLEEIASDFDAELRRYVTPVA